jgi:predicted O-linked N-acetylglucosamine transferase (SPINDLY family)
MNILNSKKDSVLWLLEQEDEIKDNLLNAVAKYGIEKERIIFSKKISNKEHIQRQMCADLFLDTFPICAHTTASDALWVGLPIVTMAGNSMVSRVAGSALKNIGMQELITYNYQDYKSKILELANNKNYLKEVRNKIISNRSSSKLFDTEGFTKNLEAEYEKLFLSFKNNR